MSEIIVNTLDGSTVSVSEDDLAGLNGANFRRLKEIKARYDPANVFRVNQNMRPD